MTSAINEAVAAFERGDHAAAAELARSVLQREPTSFGALMLLGIVAHQRGDLTEAVRLISSAIERDSASPDAYAHLAAAQAALDRHVEAVESYDAALALRPDFANAWFNRGNALRALGRFDDALASYDRALEIQPHDPGALNNRGVTLARLDRHPEALDSFARAIALAREYAEAFNNRGISLQALGFHDEAVASFQSALERRGDYPEALSNLGQALLGLGRAGQALESLQRAWALQPTAEHALHVGNALQALTRHEEALASYDSALALQPEYAAALNNRGNSLQALNRHAAAIRCYERAAAAKPDEPDAHWNEALARLALGDYRGGFEKYEWRLKGQGARGGRLPDGPPVWSGNEPLDGRTIVVVHEQGFGDAIQFVRYAQLLVERGATVHVACHADLHTLFASMPAVSGVFAPDAASPPAEFQASLMSLPFLLRTTLRSIPAAVPYLSADTDRADQWRTRLDELGGQRRVGLAWAGNPLFANATEKACPVEFLAQLLQATDITWVSLQKGANPADLQLLQAAAKDLLDPTPSLEDFGAMAAVIAGLDLVITVDTAVAHLAGALGKPVWILLPFAADWRWLVGREDSPWYPTARLFRQARAGEWSDVVRRVSRALEDFEGTGDASA
jgi:tetratricopeptide (TPR) repeat protein